MFVRTRIRIITKIQTLLSAKKVQEVVVKNNHLNGHDTEGDSAWQKNVVMKKNYNQLMGLT